MSVTPELFGSSAPAQGPEPYSKRPLPDYVNAKKDKKQAWDGVLPRIELPIDTDYDIRMPLYTFSAEQFAWSLQNGATQFELEQYLLRSNPTKSAVHSAKAKHFPLIFYVVETNNAELLQTFIKAGGDVNSTYSPDGDLKITLLVSAILNQALQRRPCTKVIITLLGYGARCDCIPSWYHENLAPLPDVLSAEQSKELLCPSKQWCKPKARQLFDKAIDPTTRYFVRKAILIFRRRRDPQVVSLYQAEALLRLPFNIIGQDLAAQRLFETLVSCMLVRRNRPRVFVFAGPSGHGKTQLADRLGDILQLDVHKVDCTNYSRQEDLFGLERQWGRGNESKGLNTFLAEHDHKAGIVVLDEIEKTTEEVRKALLVPFREGIYRDRAKDKDVNCNGIIWALTSNALDAVIMKFLVNDKNKKALLTDDFDPQARKQTYQELAELIKKHAMSDAIFGKPFTGRITKFIPFLPFTDVEQIVGVHKYLLDFVEQARRPVVIREPGDKENNAFGNVAITIDKPYAICRHLAQEFYSKDLGMPSLECAIADQVALAVTTSTSRSHTISENQSKWSRLWWISTTTRWSQGCWKSRGNCGTKRPFYAPPMDSRAMQAFISLVVTLLVVINRTLKACSG